MPESCIPSSFTQCHTHLKYPCRGQPAEHGLPESQNPVPLGIAVDASTGDYASCHRPTFLQPVAQLHSTCGSFAAGAQNQQSSLEPTECRTQLYKRLLGLTGKAHRQDVSRGAQHYCVLYNAFALTPTEFQQAVKDEPAATCRASGFWEPHD